MGAWITVAPASIAGMISDFIKLLTTAAISMSSPKIFRYLIFFHPQYGHLKHSLLDHSVPVFVLGAKGAFSDQN